MNDCALPVRNDQEDVPHLHVAGEDQHREDERNAICRYCEKSMIFFRSTRSAMTPPKARRSASAPVARKPSRPRRKRS
jgi:hypothetical protein